MHTALRSPLSVVVGCPGKQDVQPHADGAAIEQSVIGFLVVVTSTGPSITS